MPRKISEGMQSGIGRGTGALPYYHWFAGQQFRPNGKMPIDAHKCCALSIKLVLNATEGCLNIENCLNQVRGNLDEYVMREYKVEESDQETFLNLYYGDFYHIHPGLDQDRLIPCLKQLKSTLRRHYPDGSPLRELLMWVDRAIVWVEKWLIKIRLNSAKYRGNDFGPQPRL